MPRRSYTKLTTIKEENEVAGRDEDPTSIASSKRTDSVLSTTGPTTTASVLGTNSTTAATHLSSTPPRLTTVHSIIPNIDRDIEANYLPEHDRCSARAQRVTQIHRGVSIFCGISASIVVGMPFLYLVVADRPKLVEMWMGIWS